MDRREDAGEFYPGGKVISTRPVATGGDVKHSDFAGLDVKTNTIPDLREAVRELGRRLGATVVTALAVCVASAATVQTVPVNDLDFDANPSIVTNVVFDAPPDFSTNNTALVETIEATAPAPGDYAVVSNAAVHAAITNALQDAELESLSGSISTISDTKLDKSGGTMTGGIYFGAQGIYGYLSLEYDGETHRLLITDGWNENLAYLEVPNTADGSRVTFMSDIDAAISPTSPAFSNAVLSVGLGIDTNTVAVINELVDSAHDLPVTGATSVGALLLATAAAIAALKKRRSYALVTKTIENGAVTLDDRAANYVDARTLGSSDSLDIDFPTLVYGKARDFVLAVECGANPPAISYAAFVTIMAEDASTLTPEEGMNIYAFTEFKTNMFLASRKTVDTVVVNTPESADQLLLAMQKRGIDTTGITDFGGVATALGLGDTATPQDAIDAVMN